MITVDFITALFYEVDEQLRALPKHPEAHLWPSEVVTLGLLHALKGGGNRAFSRWLTRDSRALFPYSQKTRNQFDSSVYDPATAQASACLLPTPSCILDAKGEGNKQRETDAWVGRPC